MYVYIGFKTFFLRCPTPRLHRFLSSHCPSFRFLSFMAFFIPSIQFFFSLPRAHFCFAIHFNAILGSLSSALLWTLPYHVSWFCPISFIIVSSSPICCLIVTFLILPFLDILYDLLRASISVASTRLLLFSISLHVSEPYNKLHLINAYQCIFNFLSFLMSLLHSIPFKHAIHFLACITLDLISLSSVPIVSKITPKYLYYWQNSISLSLSNFKLLCVPSTHKYFVSFKFMSRPHYSCLHIKNAFHPRNGNFSQPHTAHRTEIPALMDSWVTNTHSAKILCIRKKLIFFIFS